MPHFTNYHPSFLGILVKAFAGCSPYGVLRPADTSDEIRCGRRVKLVPSVGHSAPFFYAHRARKV